MNGQRKLLTLAVGVAAAVVVFGASTGGASAGFTPLCGGVAVTIDEGTPGNDVITGTEGPDVIQGGLGDDAIDGLGGDDLICGGQGNDDLIGGPNSPAPTGVLTDDDEVRGGGHRDRIRGGDGDDFVRGAAGTDAGLVDFQGTPSSLPAGIHGENGNDQLNGGFGDDQLEGGAGDDDHHGGPSTDTCLDIVGTNTFESCETGPPPVR